MYKRRRKDKTRV